MAPNPYSHYFKVLVFYTIIYFTINFRIIRWHLSLLEVNQANISLVVLEDIYFSEGNRSPAVIRFYILNFLSKISPDVINILGRTIIKELRIKIFLEQIEQNYFLNKCNPGKRIGEGWGGGHREIFGIICLKYILCLSLFLSIFSFLFSLLPIFVSSSLFDSFCLLLSHYFTFFLYLFSFSFALFLFYAFNLQYTLQYT